LPLTLGGTYGASPSAEKSSSETSRPKVRPISGSMTSSSECCRRKSTSISSPFSSSSREASVKPMTTISRGSKTLIIVYMRLPLGAPNPVLWNQARRKSS